MRMPLLVLLFFIIILDTSFYTIEAVSGIVRCMAGIICIGILLFINGKKITVKKDVFATLIFAIIYFFIAGLLEGSVEQATIIAICVFVGFFVTTVFDEKEFIKYYEKILYFLAVYSLITFLIQSFAPQIARFLPLITTRGGVNYYNSIFSVINDNDYVANPLAFFRN